MRALVTGATGFVGRNLCAYLVESGWLVTALHREESSAETLTALTNLGVQTYGYSRFTDISQIVDSGQPDVVFHLAAHFSRSPQAEDITAYIASNVTFGTHLIDALVGTSTTVVNAASYSQFRAGKQEPTSLYAASKQAFLSVARYYSDHHSLDFRSVVLNDNYGPDDSRDKLVNQLVNAVRTNVPIALGNSEQWINLMHIRDLVVGLVAASAPGEPEFMRVRADEDVTVATVVKIVDDAAGNTLVKTFHNDLPTDDRVLQPSTWPRPSGWTPQTPLDVGLRELLRQ